MDNDSRGLLFFILGFTCVWLVFDNFFGKKYVNNLATLLTPSIPSLLGGSLPTWKAPQDQIDKQIQESKNKIDSDPSLSDAEKTAKKNAIDDFYKNDPLAKAGPQAT
jgi:hypothetical protein